MMALSLNEEADNLARMLVFLNLDNFNNRDYSLFNDMKWTGNQFMKILFVNGILLFFAEDMKPW